MRRGARALGAGRVASPRLALLVLAFGVVFTRPLGAREQSGERPIVRAQIETATPVMVGETVTLSVDVLVPTWMPRAPRFPAALDVEGAIAVFDEGFRTNLSERVGRETWSGIRRQYLIYPQLPGEYTVPPVEVEVVYALPDAKPSAPVRLTGPELRFDARVPPEAVGLGYFIAARRFSLEQTLEPSPQRLRVGDAVRRTITTRAEEASSMMLPATEFPPIEGLAVYPDPSRASDGGGERGSPRRARRVDSATYVLEREGRYTLPEVRLSWWDVAAGRLREASVPAVAFDVAPNPELAGELALPPEPGEAEEGSPQATAPGWRERLPVPVAVAAGLAVLAWLASRFRRRLGARITETLELRRESPQASFGRLLDACRANDAHGTMRALMAWLDRGAGADEGLTLERWLRATADAGLSAAVAELEQALYGREAPAAWRGDRLAPALRRARRVRPYRRPSLGPSLAPLNPRSMP